MHPPWMPWSRFIPAGAGNTRRRWYRGFRIQVHPRGCGEHGAGGVIGAWPGGSSPRVRGTPRGAVGGEIPCRFIPAGAGNTHRSNVAPTATSVHPRGCGEHTTSISRREGTTGSSPRVRGTPERPWNAGIMVRFIPAGAGNTTGIRSHRRARTVHPRGCGEHCGQERAGRYDRGSSPRVRGTQLKPLVKKKRERFIPAGAGNTPPR